MLQAPPRKWDYDRLKFFKLAEHEMEIETLAAGLSIEETLLYYGITPEVLSDKELAYDKWFFMTTYNRGRIKSKQQAVRGLFKAIDNSNVQAALSYLVRFADKWESKVEDGDTEKIKGFKIVLDGD